MRSRCYISSDSHVLIERDIAVHPGGTARQIRCIVLCLVFSVALSGSTRAQEIDLGGQVFLDYFYRFSSPVESQEGLHGFSYRRLNLTTDVTLSEDFWGRARLEASDAEVGPLGPVVFVKDLSVTWNYTGEHQATVGVTPPPAFELSERVWGYRSLEKTILDFQGVVGSRDFGIRFDGPIANAGDVRYAVMFANNSATRPETDVHKRLYALISVHPTPSLFLSVGADHAAFGDQRASESRFSGFGGFLTDPFSAGIEAFYSTLELADDTRLNHMGVSLFGSAQIHPKWDAVARLDRASEELILGERRGTFFLGGLAFIPNQFVRLIPNLWLFKLDGADEAEISGRFTVSVDF